MAILCSVTLQLGERISAGMVRPCSSPASGQKRELRPGRSGLTAVSSCNKVRPRKDALFSFNHLIGAQQNRLWNRKPERLGRLLVDRQLKLRRLQNGQVGWLGALENPPDVDATLTICIRDAGAATHQATNHNIFTI